MSINRVTLLGNLGDDPELKYTNSSLPVCNLRVATHEYRKKDGESVKETEWHRVSVFGKQAENCAKYLTKGRQILAEGKIKTRKWEDAQGVTKYSTEIIAFHIEFLGASPRGDTQDTQTYASPSTPANLSTPTPVAVPTNLAPPTVTPTSEQVVNTAVQSVSPNVPSNLGAILGTSSEENS